MLQDTENNSTIELINLILISSCYKLFIFDKGIVFILKCAKKIVLLQKIQHYEKIECHCF